MGQKKSGLGTNHRSVNIIKVLILRTRAWDLNIFINLCHRLYVRLVKLGDKGIINKSIQMKDETGRGKSPLTYHQGQKVPHSCSPQRASLPLQRHKACCHVVVTVYSTGRYPERDPECADKPTCPVDPGPVAVQLSLNLLLASQLHESPAVLHPLPFLSKLPEPQMTKSLDSESSMRTYVPITQVFLLETQPEERILLLIVHSAIRAEKRREEKRGEQGLVSHSEG